MNILVKWNRFEDSDFVSDEGEDLVHFREVVRLRPKELWIHNPVINPLTYLLFEARAQLVVLLLNYPPTYFSARHRLATSTRRGGDLAFCMHVWLDHLATNEPMHWTERLRYYWLYYARYRPEMLFTTTRTNQEDPQYADFLRYFNQEYMDLYIAMQQGGDLASYHRRG